MSTLVEDLLPILDELRGLPDELGLRPYAVRLQITTWTPDADDDTDIQLGRGTSSVVESPIALAGGARPKVRRVNYKETVAAGGKYQQGDFRIGPMTPNYLGGGLTFAMMAPTGTRDARTHYHFVLTGPDLPAGGMLCQPVQEEADHPMHRYLVVRPEGVVP